MKLLIITLTITFLIVGIENNNLLSTKNSLIEEKKESYHACIRLKLKAPNLNLKCEKILDNIFTNKETDIKNEIKTLFIRDTRKVHGSEEIKLRNLIQDLSNRNKLEKE